MNPYLCFECRKYIEDWKYKMVPLDSPYTNLFFHTDCLAKVNLEYNFDEYLKEKYNEILEYDTIISKKTKRNSREKVDELLES